MTQKVPDTGKRLSRQEISDAVGDLGWRYVLGTVRTAVPVASLAQAADVAARVVATAGDDGDGSLWLDVRRDRVVLTLQSLEVGRVTPLEVELAGRISEAVSELGLRTGADVGARDTRSIQILELGIDALDIAAIRPFWKAVMGYDDEAGASGEEDPLVDPLGQGPAIWFQQMDAPRPQRNRIHFDVSVPHDEAPGRIKAALAAGGVLLSDVRAPAFWVLADAEGNEACVTTWQGRD
ncbi:VOC family protein [Streptosporangium lutulentum]|uniref:4a-hydroxytetrahydrobiopterin dehydratase n=1 Tax=Streptosporangium lutulentum TaxID=1461250 RepID=A0ABT9QDI5_9ACTN|nr:VOC family protein [Streptosporangium lutulentum]MDP9843999.1 4a-hydroxytetrahydrobiopterin dehydratase [Streptosporangium lutulentum]